ncbi:hypothetical protein BVY02_02645 [bacterium J17]|nr:hypothetical protein BVY02_02645 [bacterium J17]
MKKVIIKRLFESFSELEKAIESARETLEKKENPPVELLERISSYEGILAKQRSLATALCGHASLGNWDEVARHVKIINGLSSMIRDDAREIISGATPRYDSEQREAMLC